MSIKSFTKKLDKLEKYASNLSVIVARSRNEKNKKGFAKYTNNGFDTEDKVFKRR